MWLVHGLAFRDIWRQGASDKISARLLGMRGVGCVGNRHCLPACRELGLPNVRRRR